MGFACIFSGVNFVNKTFFANGSLIIFYVR